MNMTRVESIQFEELDETSATGEKPMVKRDVDALGHVAVQLDVVVGNAVSTIGELFQMAEGQVLKLDRGLDELLELRLNGKTFARGQLVASGDHFGIKIVELA
ncbi:hypothetical protein GCM10027285_26910 [Oleiagrimonas citrea]|uniref:Flagellar motor switch protein FliN n=1 Tax=Oleiagrimonas citrea TaxID=1665687 RepID=A0A846ZNI6_9GAMM|nr:FliM/FliN family flagellar motor switch protein [Oleiagrimonas citrea]NKZ39031.1 flagellar motor switch protein FliN [Oleiagrimonas citrea]